MLMVRRANPICLFLLPFYTLAALVGASLPSFNDVVRPYIRWGTLFSSRTPEPSRIVGGGYNRFFSWYFPHCVAIGVALVATLSILPPMLVGWREKSEPHSLKKEAVWCGANGFAPAKVELGKSQGRAGPITLCSAPPQGGASSLPCRCLWRSVAKQRLCISETQPIPHASCLPVAFEGGHGDSKSARRKRR